MWVRACVRMGVLHLESGGLGRWLLVVPDIDDKVEPRRCLIVVFGPNFTAELQDRPKPECSTAYVGVRVRRHMQVRERMRDS